MTTFAKNKRASFDYELQDNYEAGLVLHGHEVKAIRDGHISLNGAHVSIRGEELYLLNAHISKYKHAGNLDDYDPERPRKLLLHRTEIKKLLGSKTAEGLTFVPIRVYNKGRRIKLAFALGRGKKKYDKRDQIKKRDNDRNIQRHLRDA